MKDYFNEAVEISREGPETEEQRSDRYDREFREYLVREFCIIDPAAQDRAIEIFDEIFVGAIIRSGLLTDPIAIAKKQLERRGITTLEDQKPVLQRLYQDMEDPRPPKK